MAGRSKAAMAQLNVIVPRGQDGYWAIMLQLDQDGPWSLRDVELRSNVPGGTIARFLRKLVRGGVVAAAGTRPSSQPSKVPATTYRLLKHPPTTSGYVLDTLLSVPATIGRTTGDFYSGPTWRWDRVNSLYLFVRRGALSSASEELVLSGANVLAIENVDGEWEYLQFATATPNGTRNYILTNLLRGQRGSEHAMRSPVAAGARVMLINGAVKETGLNPAHVGLTLNWKAGRADEGIGSASAISFTKAMTGRGRRPLSPARLMGLRNAANGDWTISWLRRTRLGGDSWEVAEVPLGEASESYLLEILSGPGGAVLRSFSALSPSQLYTSAQQIADFGANQLSFYARVAQLSDTFGAGIPLTEQIWIR